MEVMSFLCANILQFIKIMHDFLDRKWHQQFYNCLFLLYSEICCDIALLLLFDWLGRFKTFGQLRRLYPILWINNNYPILDFLRAVELE
jgi:hypothetical protein